MVLLLIMAVYVCTVYYCFIVLFFLLYVCSLVTIGDVKACGAMLSMIVVLLEIESSIDSIVMRPICKNKTFPNQFFISVLNTKNTIIPKIFHKYLQILGLETLFNIRSISSAASYSSPSTVNI